VDEVGRRRGRGRKTSWTRSGDVVDEVRRRRGRGPETSWTRSGSSWTRSEEVVDEVGELVDDVRDPVRVHETSWTRSERARGRSRRARGLGRESSWTRSESSWTSFPVTYASVEPRPRGWWTTSTRLVDHVHEVGGPRPRGWQTMSTRFEARARGHGPCTLGPRFPRDIANVAHEVRDPWREGWSRVRPVPGHVHDLATTCHAVRAHVHGGPDRPGRAASAREGRARRLVVGWLRVHRAT
jgi:hypothetical protein